MVVLKKTKILKTYNSFMPYTEYITVPVSEIDNYVTIGYNYVYGVYMLHNIEFRFGMQRSVFEHWKEAKKFRIYFVWPSAANSAHADMYPVEED